MCRLQNLVGFRRQAGKSSASDRLHDHDRNVALLQDLILFLRRTIVPVIIIQLDLCKIPLVMSSKTSERIYACMAGKAQITDTAFLFLLKEILNRTTV